MDIPDFGLSTDDEYFRQIVHAASDLILVIGSRGRVEYANPASMRILGYDPSEVIGTHLLDWVHEDDRDASSLAIEAEYSGRNPLPVLDVKARAADGTWVPLECKVWLMRDSALPRLALIARDMRTRPAAEQMIRDRDARAYAVLASSPVAIITLDEQLAVTEWNRMAEQTYGWLAEEVRGGHLPTLPHAWDDAALLREVLQTRQTFVDQSATRRRKDGSLIETGVAIAPVISLDDRVVGLVEISTDVTAQRVVERQFERAQRLEAIARIARGVSRDLGRQTQAIIQNATELLETSDVRVANRAHSILQDATAAAALAFQLAILGGNQPLATGDVVLDGVLQHLVLRLRRDYPALRVLAVLDATGAKVGLPAEHILDLVGVLTRNATEAIGGRGSVIISTNVRTLDLAAADRFGLAPGQYVATVVEDSGPGFDPEALERATEPFYTNKGTAEHGGLGLPRALAVARRAGGNLYLENAPGAGARVTIFLPTRAATEEAPPPPEPLTGGPVGVVVAPDADIRQLARRALVRLGHQVREFAAAEDVHTLRDASVALLITPLVLPTMAGRDLARLLRTLHPKLAVIYLAHDHGSTGALGARDALVNLPCTASRLEAAITTLQLLAP